MEDEPIYPFEDIQQVESYVPQLFHLRCVNLLVIPVDVSEFETLSHEHYSEQVDMLESLYRDKLVIDYSHGFKSFPQVSSYPRLNAHYK